MPGPVFFLLPLFPFLSPASPVAHALTVSVQSRPFFFFLPLLLERPFVWSFIPAPLDVNREEMAFSYPPESSAGPAKRAATDPHRYALLAHDVHLVPRDVISSPWKGKARALDMDAHESHSTSFVARWLSSPDPHPPLLIPRDSSSNNNNDGKGINVLKSVPMLVLVIVGSVVLVATISVSLAWLCRGACGKNRKSRRRRLNRAMWSPGATESVFDEKKSTTGGDDKLSLPTTPLPVLLSDQPSATPAPGGRGWSLHDPPVGANSSGAARDAPTQNVDASKTDLESGQNAASSNVQPARQPSFITRAMQQRGVSLPLPITAPQPQQPMQHRQPVAVLTREPTRRSQVSEAKTSGTNASRITYQGEVFTKGPYPTVRPLPGYGTDTPCVQQGTALIGPGASRFPGASSSAPNGGRSVLSMIPATLRNAARASIGNRHMRPRSLNDSDFEGTIGGRDRDLPMAKRIGKKDPRFSVDCSTEDEPSPRVFASPLPQMLGTPRIQGRPDATPGLAGVGASWSKPMRHTTIDIGHQQAKMAHDMPPPQHSTTVPTRIVHVGPFPSNVMMYPLAGPQSKLGQLVKQGNTADPRQNLIATVSKWQESSKDAEPVGDPFATPANSVAGDGKRGLARRHSIAASDAAVSDVTSVSRGSTMTSFTALYEGKGAINKEKSPVPSIRPQFAATTTLSSWLDPAKVSTTHGLVIEEEEWEDMDPVTFRDPFDSDIDVLKKKPSALSLSPSEMSPEEKDSPVAAPLPVSSKRRRRSRAVGGSDSERSLPPSYRTCSDKERRGRKRASPSPKMEKRCARRSRQDGGAGGKAKSRASSKTRSKGSFRSSAAQSTVASTVLTSLFDEEDEVAVKKQKQPRQSSAAAERVLANAQAAAARRKSLQVQVQMEQSEEHDELAPLPLPAAETKLTRCGSGASESVYSSLTAPEEYELEYRAPILAEAGAKVHKRKSKESLAEKSALSRNPKDNPTDKSVPKRKSKVMGVEAAAAPRKPRHAPKNAVVDRSVKATRTVSQPVAPEVTRFSDKRRRSYAAPRNLADYDDEDSPWSSSDSDISVRRWGVGQGPAVPAASAGRRRR